MPQGANSLLQLLHAQGWSGGVAGRLCAGQSGRLWGRRLRPLSSSSFCLSFFGLLPVGLNVLQMCLNRGIFTRLDVTCRRMSDVASVNEHSVYLDSCSAGTGVLNHVSNRDGSNVLTVLEESRRQNLAGDFIEGLPRSRPTSKDTSRICAVRSVENPFFFVGVGSVDDLILRHLLHRLQNVSLRNLEPHQQALPVVIFRLREGQRKG